MTKERQATAAEFMGLKPYPERESTQHDDKMLIFALRDENDSLRDQVREMVGALEELLLSLAKTGDNANVSCGQRAAFEEARALLAKVRP